MREGSKHIGKATHRDLPYLIDVFRVFQIRDCAEGATRNQHQLLDKVSTQTNLLRLSGTLQVKIQFTRSSPACSTSPGPLSCFLLSVFAHQ